MQEVDAQRRLAILRGEIPPPLPEKEEEDESNEKKERDRDERSRASGSTRRMRKRPGEDDTDFELRLANERNEANAHALVPTKKETSSAPIVDHTGHIDLFGDTKLRAHAEKNEEAEKDAQKKKREYEDQYTMRFSNAAGRDGLKGKPWYSQSEEQVDAPLQDVWGNEDPRRREREAQRTFASDPLAMMKRGAKKVREIKAERRKEKGEQDEAINQLIREERRREWRSRDDDGRERRRREERDASRGRERRRDRRDEHDSKRRHHMGRDGGGRSSRRRSRSPEERRRHRDDKR